MKGNVRTRDLTNKIDYWVFKQRNYIHWGTNMRFVIISFYFLLFHSLSFVLRYSHMFTSSP